jgi:protein arginine kinase
VTLDLSLIPDGGLHWLTASGEHAGIVLSSRIRLARNIAGFAFPTRAREGERLRVLHQLRDAAARSASLRSAALVRVDECTAQERLLLHERHLVSRELAGLDRQQGVMATGAGAVLLTGEAGLMVNEEDHLRLQVFRSGFDIPGALREAERIDQELGAELPYAWHKEFGFLTACPTNTGG